MTNCFKLTCTNKHVVNVMLLLLGCRLNSCLSSNASVNCSGHGTCINGICTCDGTYTGDACDIPICPGNCSGPDHGTCNREQHKCDCEGDYRGTVRSLLKNIAELCGLQVKTAVSERNWVTGMSCSLRLYLKALYHIAL
jgi:hypothetical protein